MYLQYLVLIVAFFVFESNGLSFPRDFSNHFPDCICLGGGVKSVYKVLPVSWLP